MRVGITEEGLKALRLEIAENSVLGLKAKDILDNGGLLPESIVIELNEIGKTLEN